MEKYIPVLKKTRLFAGVGDEEIMSMLSCLGILTGHALAVIPVSKMTYPTARIIKNWSPLLRRFLTVIC